MASWSPILDATIRDSAKHLRTWPCRLLLAEIEDILMAAAYMDGATIEELRDMFDNVHPSILNRLRAKGYNLPHRKCGTHWNISEGETE